MANKEQLVMATSSHLLGLHGRYAYTVDMFTNEI